MATQTFSVAPSVQFTERDVTLNTTPSVDVIGATVGSFQWGEAEKPIRVTNGPDGLVKKFFKPKNDALSAMDFLVTESYLTYSSVAWVCRMVGPLARNAVTKGQQAVIIKNSDEFEGVNVSPSITWAGRYPGALGNDLVIDVCDSVTFPTWEFRNAFSYAPQPGEFHVVVVDTVGRITGTNGATSQVERIQLTGTATAAGKITVNGTDVAYLKDDTAAVVAGKISDKLKALTGEAQIWSDVGYKSNTVTLTLAAIGPQTQSAVVNDANGIVGKISTTTVGSSGTIVDGEKFQLLQLNPGAKRTDGSNAYFKDVINGSSYWVYVLANTLAAGRVELTGGVDDDNIDRIEGYEMLKNAEAYSAKPIFGYADEIGVQQHMIDVSASRRDTVTFVSPLRDTVVNNRGREADAVEEWRSDLLRDSSYFFMDDNWGYYYDKYNDVYRWIPACGSTAGVWARNIRVAGIYKSPAFHNRGKYANFNKMAWSADSGQRTQLYKVSVNSIVTFPTEGIVLYGDKTGLSAPSAFDRINVRGLFIMAEQNITASAKYYLGENNDANTRLLFTNSIAPYIRTLIGLGAISDGKVKCDEDNNPAAIVAANQMVAGVWLKPAYSINWIYLDFAAVRPDIEFSEVESGGGIVSAS